MSPTYISIVRLRSVCASGSPWVIQPLLVFATFRNWSSLFCHRAAASCFRTSALPTSVVLLFLGSPPVRLATLRLRYSDRKLPRGQGATSWFWQIDHNSAPAHWRVFIRHSARTESSWNTSHEYSRLLFSRIITKLQVLMEIHSFTSVKCLTIVLYFWLLYQLVWGQKLEIFIKAN